MENNNEAQLLTPEAEEILTPEAVSLIKVEGRELSQRVMSLKVTNEDSYKEAVELGVATKRVLTRVEAFRKALTKPLNDHITMINGIFRGISSKFVQYDSRVRTETGRYLESRKKTESVQNVHAGGGRATVTTRWVYEIIDARKVPREWCIPDEARIGRSVRAGALRELAGVKIKQEKTTSFSAK